MQKLTDLRDAWVNLTQPAVSMKVKALLEQVSSGLVVPDTALDLTALQGVINMCNSGDKHSTREYATCAFVVCECVCMSVFCACTCARVFVRAHTFLPSKLFYYWCYCVLRWLVALGYVRVLENTQGRWHGSKRN